MTEQATRTVRWRWIAVALVVAVGVAVTLLGFQSGSCTEYVNAPSVCTGGSVADAVSRWVMASIGGGVVVFALVRAFRRR